MPKATPPSVVMTDTHAVLILPITDSARPNANQHERNVDEQTAQIRHVQHGYRRGVPAAACERFETYFGQARRERLTYERAHDLRAHVDEDDEQHEADGEQVSSDPSGQIGEQRAEAEQWFRG